MLNSFWTVAKWYVEILIFKKSLFRNPTQHTTAEAYSELCHIQDGALAKKKTNSIWDVCLGSVNCTFKINSLMSGGNNRSYILKQTCRFYVQPFVSMYDLLLAPDIKVSRNISPTLTTKRPILPSYRNKSLDLFYNLIDCANFNL